MKIARLTVLALCMTAIILCSWLAPLDTPATQQVDAGLKRALLSFATARTLNGVISVVQGTQFSAQPFGVGVSLTPGQLLAPVNELVKHFSDLMLAASVAFGVQKVLISIGSYWLISLVLTVIALGWMWCYFRRQPPPWLSRILVILLMLRFAVPLVTIATDLLSQKFLADDYVASQQAIDISSGKVATLNPPVSTVSETPGLMEKMKDWFSQNKDVKMRFEELKKTAEQATEHMIKLMVIFLLQTLFIPLLLLWCLYGVLRGAFELPHLSPVPVKR